MIGISSVILIVSSFDASYIIGMPTIIMFTRKTYSDNSALKSLCLTVLDSKGNYNARIE